jgi:hypothetical protein
MVEPVSAAAGRVGFDTLKAGVDVLDKLGVLDRLSLTLVSSPDIHRYRTSTSTPGLG